MTGWNKRDISWLEDEDPEKAFEVARRLVALGYLSISHRYRIVRRLPPGMTGKEALARACSERGHKGYPTLDEDSSRSQFLRCYSNFKGAPELVLGREMFREFKRAGGRFA